MPTGKQQSG